MAEPVNVTTDEIINSLSRQNAFLRIELEKRAQREDELRGRIALLETQLSAESSKEQKQ